MTVERTPEAIAKASKRAGRSLKMIREGVDRGSREPWKYVLSMALKGCPSSRDWRQLAKSDPHKWAAGVKSLAEPAGYVPRTVNVEARVDLSAVVTELAARLGPERASTMLDAMGLPSSLIAAGQGVTVEGSLDVGPDEAGAPLQDVS